MSDSVYCYPDSDVLLNKFGIRGMNELFAREAVVTGLRLIRLFNHPVTGNFDLPHLCEIHRYIFQDIYPWAGKTRTVNIAKENWFCRWEYIDSQSKKLFAELKSDHYLKDLPKENLLARLAYYFAEINAIHPFREGNGRAQREFIRLLALMNGVRLQFSNVGRDELIRASRDSMSCDYSGMEEIIKKCAMP